MKKNLLKNQVESRETESKNSSKSEQVAEVTVNNDEINASNIGQIVQKIMDSNTKKGKTVIRMEFEFHNE